MIQISHLDHPTRQTIVILYILTYFFAYNKTNSFLLLQVFVCKVSDHPEDALHAVV